MPPGAALRLELSSQLLQLRRIAGQAGDNRNTLAFAPFGFSSTPDYSVATDHGPLLLTQALFGRPAVVGAHPPVDVNGNGKGGEYVGGYDDYVRQRKADTPLKPAKPPSTAEKQRPNRQRKATISSKKQRELEALPGLIELLETEQHGLYQSMANQLLTV